MVGVFGMLNEMAKSVLIDTLREKVRAEIYPIEIIITGLEDPQGYILANTIGETGFAQQVVINFS